VNIARGSVLVENTFNLSSLIDLDILSKYKYVGVHLVRSSSGFPWMRVFGLGEEREIAQITFSKDKGLLVLPFKNNNQTSDPYMPGGPFYFDKEGIMIMDAFEEGDHLPQWGVLKGWSTVDGSDIDMHHVSEQQFVIGSFEKICGVYVPQIDWERAYPIVRKVTI